jgi:hypothetical protein
MTVQRLEPNLSREDVLVRIVGAQREIHDLLEQAAHLTTDPEERRLFERLAGREEASLEELKAAEERLDAEVFVQKALDV